MRPPPIPSAPAPGRRSDADRPRGTGAAGASSRRMPGSPWHAGWACLLLALASLVRPVLAQPALPDPPPRHVSDRAGILQPATVARIDRDLTEFEQATSSQVVVWTERRLPPGTTLEEHVNRVFAHWGIGRKDRNNGVLLAVFVDDRQMRIEVGYGLEGALPDVTAGRIIRNEITPRFRSGDFDGGISEGVKAILAATRGEYRASSRPPAFRGEFRLKPVTIFFMVLAGLAGGVAGFFARGLVLGARHGTAGLLQRIPGGILGAIGHAAAIAAYATAGIPIALFLLVVLWSMILGRNSGISFGGSGMSGGSGWGGGGGFSGGGGSSGGGGASGSW